MKRLLLSTVLTLSLSGCLMPSGINPTLGCSPITGCQQKDFYLPGKGVWAPKDNIFTKAKFGAIGGAAIGASMGKDPVSAALYGVVGLVVGYSLGDTMDKVDQLYAAKMMENSMNLNANGVSSSYSNPKNNLKVTNTPISNSGVCRQFITDVLVSGEQRKMKGTACKINSTGEWELKDLYKN